MTTRWALALLIVAAGCGHPLHEEPGGSSGGASTSTGGTTGGTTGGPTGTVPGSGPVDVHGSAAKGPFVLGSSITLFAIDASGTPTGRSFITETTSDLGEFTVTVPYSGDVNVEAQGYFFDELAGTVSTSTLTLEGYGTLVGGQATLDVNVITQLLSGRVAALRGTLSVADAAAQAQRELVQSLAIGGSGFTLDGAANATDLANGTSTSRAYLLTVSLLFLQVAHDTASGPDQVDATLQVLLNDARASLAANGALSAQLVAQLQQAQAEIDPDAVLANLSARYSGDPSFTPPELGAVLDSDLDGIPNDADTCPLTPNASQGSVDGLCAYRRWQQAPVPRTDQFVLFAGDVDGDGKVDLVEGYLAGSGGLFWRGRGDGTFDAPATIAANSFSAYALADVDGDGRADLVGDVGFSLSAPPVDPTQYLGYLPSLGDGGFGAPIQIFPPYTTATDPSGTSASYGCNLWGYFADLNGDGRIDAFAPCAEDGMPPGPGTPYAVLGALQRPDGGFDPPQRLGTADPLGQLSLSFADFDRDGRTDLLIAACGGINCAGTTGGAGGMWIAHAADGGFSVDAITSSLGPDYEFAAPGDFDGDGRQDILVGTQLGGPIDVLINGGSESFAPSSSLHWAQPPYASPTVLDLNGDSAPALLFWPSGTTSGDAQYQLYGIRSGAWTQLGAIGVGPVFTVMATVVTDLDGDGRPDLALVYMPPTSNDLVLETVVLNPAGYHSW